MTSARRLVTALLIVVTTVGATFVVLVAGGSGTLELGGVRLVYIVAAAIALIPWLTFGVLQPAFRPRSRLFPALLLCLVVVTLCTVTSRVPRLSIEMLGYIVLLVEVYLLLVGFMLRPAIRQHFQRLALLLCLLISVFYLFQVGSAWQTWWGLVGHLAIPPLRPYYAGLTSGPNPIATAVLTLGSFGLAASLLPRMAGRVTAAVVTALVLVVTLMTGSRGAWLGMSLGIVAVVAVGLLLEPDLRSTARRLARTRVTLAIVALGVPILVGGIVIAAVSGRLTVDDAYRTGYARASIAMFDSSPLTGVGPAVWPTLRAANTLPSDADLYIPHAHSIYFQTIAEFGLAGVVASIVVVIALGALIVRSIRSGDPIRRRVAYAALFGVVLLAGQQYADMLMNVPVVLFAIALPIAWLDATSLEAEPAPDPPGVLDTRRARVGAAVGAIVTVAIIVGLLRIESVASVSARSVDAADAGHWAESATLASQALADDPDLNVYRFNLGLAEANAGDLQAAATHLTASASADDYTYAWLDLAAVRWKLGDDAGAADALTRAERLGIHRPSIAVAAGWLRQQLADEEAATRDYAAAIAGAPTLADDPSWASLAGVAGLVDEARAVATPMARLQIDLVVGRLDQAQQDLAADAPVDPALASVLIPAWQGAAAAWASAQALAERRPLDGALIDLVRLVAVHLGDDAQNRRLGDWLAVLGEGDAGLPPVYRIRLGGTEDLPPNILDRYGSLYRRPAPSAQVVSLLPQVILQDHP